jgi:hypothetical protein
MGTITYEVLRDHGTGPVFKKGDTRELAEHEARPLVEGGTLRPVGEADPEQAANPDLVEQAKAERAAPQNKAEPVPDFNKTKPRVPRE